MTDSLTEAEVLSRLPAIIADCLAVEPEEVTATAGFFTELGGDSIDTLDLSFRCENAFGVKAPFRLFHGSKDQLAFDEENFVTAETIQLIREHYPFFAARLDGLNLDRFRKDDLKGLFTVEVIARFVLHAAGVPVATVAQS